MLRLILKLFGRSGSAAHTWIEPAELSAILRKPKPPLVIDVRTPAEFHGPMGHVPKSENIPLDRVPAEASELVRRGKPIIIICHSDRRSRAAARFINQAGGTDIAVLRGGMVAWQASH